MFCDGGSTVLNALRRVLEGRQHRFRFDGARENSTL